MPKQPEPVEKSPYDSIGAQQEPVYDNMPHPNKFQKRESFPGDVSVPVESRGSIKNPANDLYVELIAEPITQPESVYMDMQGSRRLTENKRYVKAIIDSGM